VAASRWEMVVTKYGGKTFLTVRGPETVATPAYSPANAEFIGILFKPSAFMPQLPAQMVMDRRDLGLPEANSKSFWLQGSMWQYPEYENADTFVERLVREGLLVADPAVEEALRGQPPRMSLRTLQRRFLRATGLTQNAFHQIERARRATMFLKEGLSILDTVEQAGYFDQPHLTRSLRHFIGLTPAQITDKARPQRLSFLYKTPPPVPVTIGPPKDKNGKNYRIGVPDRGWSHARPWGS
jgi:hypothetical protein